MKERLIKLAGPIGYPLFYVVCFGLFASLTFPYAKLKEHVVSSFNAEQRLSGGRELRIDDMSGYWLSGVSVKGVTLLSAPTEPGKPPAKIVIDDATVRYALLPLLVGGEIADFDATAFGGEVTGSYERGKDDVIDVTLDSIDLGRVAPIVDLLGVPIAGKLGGTVKLTLPDGKASKASGAISLEVRDVAVGDDKAKIQGTIALPKVDVGVLTLAAEAKDGVLKITKLIAGGRDVSVQGDGRVAMRDEATDSLLDVGVRFRINDAYRTKNDLTKSLFGAPGSTVPGLFELADPRIKQSKRVDGSYGWTVRGSLGRPEFVPSGGASAPAIRP